MRMIWGIERFPSYLRCCKNGSRYCQLFLAHWKILFTTLFVFIKSVLLYLYSSIWELSMVGLRTLLNIYSKLLNFFNDNKKPFGRSIKFGLIWCALDLAKIFHNFNLIIMEARSIVPFTYLTDVVFELQQRKYHH